MDGKGRLLENIIVERALADCATRVRLPGSRHKRERLRTIEVPGGAVRRVRTSLRQSIVHVSMNGKGRLLDNIIAERALAASATRVRLPGSRFRSQGECQKADGLQQPETPAFVPVRETS